MSRRNLGFRGGILVRGAVYRGSARRGGRSVATGATTRRARVTALITVALLCFGVISSALTVESPSTASAQGALPPPLRVISRGVPAYASTERGGPARAANDNDYKTFWRSISAPAWLAYDLSAVPGPLRGTILLAWYNDPITPDYDYSLSRTVPYNLPVAYTIEGNSAGTGAVPQSGWRVLATVTGNKFHSRQHVVNFGGYNWVRLNVTGIAGASGNQDIALNMDIYDGSLGISDSWIFYGDYITAGAMDHDPRGIGTFSQLINNQQRDYFPAQESGGTSYAQSGDGARLIREWLAVFPGRYVALNYGTTDADFFPAGKPELPADFYKNYDQMVKAVLEVGKIPVVPKIPYGRTEKIQANGPVLNQQIDRLYAAYPQIIRGPDFWAYFGGRQDLISTDNLNLTPAGLAEYRHVWAIEMLSKVYGGGTPLPPPPPGSTPGPSGCTGRLFPETGKCVNEPFLSYWNNHGALPINGFPISDEFMETLEDGKQYKVQYFERVRLELHPENPPPYDILLGQFGRKIHPADPAVAPKPGARFFPETGHNLEGSFLAYWTTNGELPQFGYPITEEITETLEDGKQYRVQYFERARFEHHPENPPPYDVLLGQFGRQILGEQQK